MEQISGADQLGLPTKYEALRYPSASFWKGVCMYVCMYVGMYGYQHVFVHAILLHVIIGD